MDPALSNPDHSSKPSSLWIKLAAAIILLVFLGGSLYATYRYGKNSNQQSLSPTPTLTATSTPTPTVIQTVDTSNWKAYTDTANKFSFKYPPTWKLDTRNNTTLITQRSSDQKATGDYTPGTAEFNWRITTESLNTVVNSISGIENKSEVTVAGSKAIRMNGYTGVAGTNFFVTTVLSIGGKTYLFNLFTQDDKLQSQFEKEYDQILSTLSLK